MYHTTDLRSDERQTVLLVQPKEIADLTASKLAQRMRDEQFLAEVARQVMAFHNLVHVGTIDFMPCMRACSNRVTDLRFKPCGGILTSSGFGAEERWTCAEKKKACDFSLFEVCGEDSGQRRSTMLHLLLKQMVPQVSACNFLDCNGVRAEDFPAGTDVEELRAVRKLGLIALADRAVFCRQKSSTAVSHITLGVFFAPGMNTQSGCHGYGNWLQLLVGMSHQLLLDVQHNVLSLLVGPKRV